MLFTALFAYNDISAIGSIWAIKGKRDCACPEDISVVGFDDIPRGGVCQSGADYGAANR